MFGVKVNSDNGYDLTCVSNINPMIAKVIPEIVCFMFMIFLPLLYYCGFITY